MGSPPVRLTRSRVTAKGSEPAVKPTKIVTAAAKVKSTLTAGTRSTAAKRKARADQDEEVDEAPAARRVRGQPKKNEEPEIHIAARAARTARTVNKPTATSSTSTSNTARPKMTMTTAATAASRAKSSAAPPKATRGRPPKAAAASASKESVPGLEAGKKTTRGRPATASTSRATGATKSTIKKTVTFQEPDKENIEPSAKAKEPATVGLRGRPVRRGITTASSTRTTKTTTTKATTKTTTQATTKGGAAAAKKPLSPKKVSQLAAVKDESEDELAGETIPVKPMMKSPIKPPSNMLPSNKIEASVEEELDETTVTVNTALEAPDMGIAMNSPAKRMPASPFKDAMKSPAKRIGPITLPGSALKLTSQSTEEANVSSFKTSLLQSAAKRPLSPIKAFEFTAASTTTDKPMLTRSAAKASLFRSPAKRAFPGMAPKTEPRRQGAPTFDNLHSMKPIAIGTPTPAAPIRPYDKLMMEDEASQDDEEHADDIFDQPLENLEFTGRLSSLLSCHEEPAWKDGMGIEKKDESQLEGEEEVDEEAEQEEEDEQQQQQEEEEEESEEEEDDEEVEEEVMQTSLEDAVTEAESEPSVASAEEIVEREIVEEGVLFTEQPEQEVDDHVTMEDESTDIEAEDEEAGAQSHTPSQSPPQSRNHMFQLRDKDMEPCYDMESESEDEATPSARIASEQTPKAERRKPRFSSIGFTPLADRLGSWSAGSPVKKAIARPLTPARAIQDLSAKSSVKSSVRSSPATPHLFEDEMLVCPEAEEKEATKMEDYLEEPSFNELPVTQEDVELAHEADEMSLIEPEQMEDVVNSSFDDTISDASQEYGDENELPIDPSIMGSPPNAPVTPVRPLANNFNTTTKVPLKPSDDSTPTALKKRSFSASKAAPKRPNDSGRSAPVVTFALTTKDRKELPEFRPALVPSTPEPATPARTNIWAALGTPARTPRPDVNTRLLQGAVAFVDVFTSDGDDASAIFVELLTQMGAKCLPVWNWQPDDELSTKLGITHVVFKDGSQDTLEKVRLSNGVVQCVGVSWVLDCETENEWLNEAPYYVDDASTPRASRRRRKSLSPVKSQKKTPRGRRESSAWMHSPSEPIEDDEESRQWSDAMLTPVPKTPAPDAVARYAANLVLETPSVDDESDEEEDDESPTKQTLLVRTCPPKKPIREMGQKLLRSEKKDTSENVMQRLMLARRKSLQFAPKIGSPLARQWKQESPKRKEK